MSANQTIDLVPPGGVNSLEPTPASGKRPYDYRLVKQAFDAIERDLANLNAGLLLVSVQARYGKRIIMWRMKWPTANRKESLAASVILRAAQAELNEAQQCSREPDLSRVINDIDEVIAHLQLIVWVERVTERKQ